MNSISFIFEDGSVETRRVLSSLKGIRKGIKRPIKVDFSNIDKEEVLRYTEVDIYKFKRFINDLSYVLQGGKPINPPEWVKEYIYG